MRDYLKPIKILRAKILPHEVVDDEMKKIQKMRINDEISDVIILVEHPEIVTMGAKAIRDKIIIDGDYKTSRVDRGGGITWHGPGQLVFYPIIKWDTNEQNIRGIIGKMEELVINALDDCGINGYRNKEMMGVWVDDKKICSIGLAFLHWVSRHGLALNYSTPEDRIESLYCCGLEKGVTTSLDKLGYTHDKEGKIIDRRRLEKALLSNIAKVLGRIPQEPISWSV
jgi:lipoate-protein ligase B